METKTITLEISEKALKFIKSDITVKRLAHEALTHPADAAFSMIIKAIEEGENQVLVKRSFE
jgi:hypothetical protein